MVSVADTKRRTDLARGKAQVLAHTEALMRTRSKAQVVARCEAAQSAPIAIQSSAQFPEAPNSSQANEA